MGVVRAGGGGHFQHGAALNLHSTSYEFYTLNVAQLKAQLSRHLGVQTQTKALPGLVNTSSKKQCA